MKEAERSLGQKIKETAEGVFFGPETTGIVQHALRDKNDPSFWHVLVVTDGGEERHFIFPERSTVIKKTEKNLGIVIEEFSARIGDPINIRTRGTGMVLMPWSKIERDPFNLKPDKKLLRK